MNLKDRLNNNKIIKNLYKAKVYSNIASSFLGYFTGKLTEIMAIVYLTEKLTGVEVAGANLVYFGSGFILAVLLLGVTLQKTGLYAIETTTAASKDPVTAAIYKAALIIIEEHEAKNWKK